MLVEIGCKPQRHLRLGTVIYHSANSMRSDIVEASTIGIMRVRMIGKLAQLV